MRRALETLNKYFSLGCRRYLGVTQKELTQIGNPEESNCLTRN